MATNPPPSSQIPPIDPNTPASGQQVLVCQEQDDDLQESATLATGPAAANGSGPTPMPAKALAQPVPAQQAPAQPVIAQPTAAQAQVEEPLINRLLGRMNELGLTAIPPEPQTEPDQPASNQTDQWQTTGDLNSWDHGAT